MAAQAKPLMQSMLALRFAEDIFYVLYVFGSGWTDALPTRQRRDFALFDQILQAAKERLCLSCPVYPTMSL